MAFIFSQANPQIALSRQHFSEDRSSMSHQWKKHVKQLIKHIKERIQNDNQFNSFRISQSDSTLTSKQQQGSILNMLDQLDWLVSVIKDEQIELSFNQSSILPKCDQYEVNQSQQKINQLERMTKQLLQQNQRLVTLINKNRYQSQLWKYKYQNKEVQSRQQNKNFIEQIRGLKQIISIEKTHFNDAFQHLHNTIETLKQQKTDLMQKLQQSDNFLENVKVKMAIDQIERLNKVLELRNTHIKELIYLKGNLQTKVNENKILMAVLFAEIETLKKEKIVGKEKQIELIRQMMVV